MNKFLQIFLTNLLIVITLIPMVVLLNGCIAFNDDPILWIIIGFLGLLLLSYLQCRDCKNVNKLK